MGWGQNYKNNNKQQARKKNPEGWEQGVIYSLKGTKRHSQHACNFKFDEQLAHYVTMVTLTSYCLYSGVSLM